MNIMSPIESFIFKATATRKLVVDLFRTNQESRGCLVVIHGGALLLGSRRDLPESVVTFLNIQGWDVASIDYRSVLEAGLEAILSDIEDGFRYVRALFPGALLIAVGYSAGAYLALFSGTTSAPLDGICAFAGYGDLTALWYYTPSTFFREYKDVEHVRERIVKRDSFVSLEDRVDLYVYLRQYGLWPEFVLGKDDLDDKAKLFSPVLRLNDSYPPTVLIHGTNDKDVPFSASVGMAEALEERGLPYELILLEGKDHDLFYRLDDEEVVGAWDHALSYLSRITAKR